MLLAQALGCFAQCCGWDAIVNVLELDREDFQRAGEGFRVGSHGFSKFLYLFISASAVTASCSVAPAPQRAIPVQGTRPNRAFAPSAHASKRGARYLGAVAGLLFRHS